MLVTARSSSLIRLNTFLRSAAFLLFAWAVFTPTLRAQQTLYWDINGAAPGSSGDEGANGFWGDANWSTSPNGDVTTQAWIDGSIANFAAGTNATGSYNVFFRVPHGARGLVFSEGQVSLVGDRANSTTPRLNLFYDFFVDVKENAIGRFHNLAINSGDSAPLRKLGKGTFAIERGGKMNLGIVRLEEGHVYIGNQTHLESVNSLWVGVDGASSLDMFEGTIGPDFFVGSQTPYSSVTIGVNPGSSGTMKLINSRIQNVPSVIVGSRGQGTLTLSSGGTVRMDTKLLLAQHASGSGTLIVEPGGTLALPASNDSLTRGAGTAELRMAGGVLLTSPGGGTGIGSGIQEFATSVPVTLAAPSTFTVQSLLPATFSAPISGSGSLTISSLSWFTAGTTRHSLRLGSVVLQGLHPYTGATLVRDGGLFLAGPTSELSSTQALELGGTGLGRVALFEGAKITPATHVQIGSEGGSGAAYVHDAGSRLVAGTFLEVGSSGPGTLEVKQGALAASTTTMTLGVSTDVMGTVQVTGAGSTLEAGGALIVGSRGTGNLSVSGGGAVTASSFLEIGRFAEGSGTVEIGSGGTLRVGGTDGIRNGAGGSSFRLSGGLLKVHQSSLNTTLPMTLANASVIDTSGLNAVLGGTLSGSGGLTKTGGGILYLNGTNTYSGGTTVEGGQIIVPSGDSLGAGPISITHGNVYSSGSLSRALAVAVLGPSASLTAAEGMAFGLNGGGPLSVAGGAQASTSGSITLGVADVSGANSIVSAGTDLAVKNAMTVGSGATVTVGGRMLLGDAGGSAASFTLNPGGILNIGGTDGIAQGSSNSIFHLAGGLLKVTNASLSTSVPMTISSAPMVDTSGVEAVFAGPLTGSGHLNKVGGGTLTLSGTNALDGPLTLWAGRIRVTSPASLSTGPLSLYDGTLDLAFEGTATVQSLRFHGVLQTGGLWGGPDSSATFKTDRIAGAGMIQVQSSVLPPVFNANTEAGLTIPISGSPIDLFAATAVSPANGVFSGAGVSEGFFYPSAAGYGLHTLTYTAGGLSSTFTISVSGGAILEQEGGSFARHNLAPSGTAFAKDVLNHPGHSIASLNDGQYGNGSSWIAGTAGSHAGIRFETPQRISRIAFGRDNTGAFADRAAGFYALQFTAAPDPTAPGAVWTTFAGVDIRVMAGITNAASRHLFRFEPLTATGVRIVPGSPEAAIDEIELYPATGLFVIGDIELVQEGGSFAPGNLAPSGTAFSQNEIGVEPHATADINDGVYGNASSWIGASAQSFAGIRLASATEIDRVAFGRDQTGEFADRSLGRYTVQFTNVANPDASTPDTAWTTLGQLDYQSATDAPFAIPSQRHLFRFPAVVATGLRIVVDAGFASFIALDEVEIYRGAPALRVIEGGIPVVENEPVTFGSIYPADPLEKSFAVINHGTATLNLGVISVSGAHTNDFQVTQPALGHLQPGESTTFTVRFAPVAAGPREARVEIASNAAAFAFQVMGTSLVPTFNDTTVKGLSFSPESGPVTLASVTEATPAGGLFSGPGVTDGIFDPAGLDFGLYTLSYTAGGDTSRFLISITGGLQLTQTGGTFAAGNIAPAATAFAQDEIGVAPHAISDVNDGLYGNDSSWISNSPVSYIGLDLGDTPVTVDKIAFGRDNTGGFLDRARGVYVLQYTTHPAPIYAPREEWISIGAVDTRSFTDPHLRRQYAFNRVTATGLRLVVQTNSDYLAIDELEVYPFVPQVRIVIEQPAGTALTSKTSQVTFAPTPTRETGETRTFTIRNTGDLPLTLAGIGVNGSHFNNFVVNLASTQMALQPGESTTFSVRFMPTGHGERSANLLVVSNAADPSVFEIPLRGMSTDTVPPVIVPYDWIYAIATDPGGVAVEFPPPAVADNSGVPPTVTFSVASGSVFPVGTTMVTITATDEAGNTATQMFGVVVSLREDSIVLETADGPLTETQEFPMLGQVLVMPMGATQLGSSSTRTLTLRNGGGAPIQIQQFVIGKPNLMEFSTVFTTERISDFIEVNPGASHDFEITFTPDTIGAQEGVAILATMSPNTEYRYILLKGEGTPGIIGPPVFPEPPSGFEVFASSAEGIRVLYPPIKVNHPLPVTVTYSPASGSVLAPGRHTVTVTATDAEARTTVASFDVDVTAADYPPAVPVHGSVPFNLALGKPAFAKDLINAPPHAIFRLNDGVYGNASSWIAGSLNSHFGIILGEVPVLIDRIAFGRDNTGEHTTRAEGTYTVQFTTAPDPGPFTSESAWQTLGVIENPGYLTAPSLRHLFAFRPVAATGLRIMVASTVYEIGVDEIEIYGGPSAPASIEAWRYRHFGSLSDSGQAADELDPDSDGIPNFIEYALGLDPRSSSQLPAPHTQDGRLGYSFTQPEGVTGVTIGAEWSPSLRSDDWHPVPNAAVPPAYHFSIPMDNAGLNGFLRLRFTKP